jgi:F0F1-type ATP synthase alpha subunit
MSHKRESHVRNIVTTEHNELGREAKPASSFANGKNHIENPYSNQIEVEAGTETELRSLRDALWEAINGIEENAPAAHIERELVILDRVAEGLGKIMTEPEDVNGTKP